MLIDAIFVKYTSTPSYGLLQHSNWLFVYDENRKKARLSGRIDINVELLARMAYNTFINSVRSLN